MTGRNWKEAERALIELAKVAAKYDDDGLEIYFLNSSSTITTNVSQPYLPLIETWSNLVRQDVEKIRNLFESVKPWGRTPLGKTLNWLLKTYMERLKTSEVKIKPVNYIVITDGEADDPHITESTIIDTARELDALNKSPSQIGIQFVQIGNDENATQFLKRLDDKLANAENGFIRARTSFSFYAAGPN
ncbi:hypothetical protein H0H92_006736 [Tricholoma furcatifolium]|nr:hypothetical protein H0H92_006736 [Tricholoma furcatifolium]